MIESLTHEDLPQVSHIQPEGWSPVIPSFQFYLESSFCYPVKYTVNDKLIGVGATILHHQTAWLAHIIVDAQYRGKGIGTQITKALIQIAEKYYSKTILLTATTLGEPVYTKLGFKKELDYLFLQQGTWAEPATETIHAYEEVYRKQILKLDRDISGEDRSKLLAPHLLRARLILQQGKVQGMYLPTLGEGLVIAENQAAGISLLSERLTPEKNRIALPAENTIIDLMKRHGYTEFLKGSRMYLGEKLTFQPSKIYSRIGGNLG